MTRTCIPTIYVGDIIFDVMNPLCFYVMMWRMRKEREREDLHLKTGIAVFNLYVICY